MRVKNLRGFYAIGDKEYISVTTILKVISSGDGLLRWYGTHGWEGAQRIMKEKAEIGSNVHKCIELYLKGQMKDFSLQSLEIKVRSELIKKWIDDTKIKVVDSERIVWSDEYKFAGSLDVLCKIKKEYCIVDFKNTSGIYPTHFIQQAAYARALKEREGINVKRLIIVRPVLGKEDEVNGIEVEERREVDELFKIFLAAKQIYCFLHPRTAMKIV